MKRPLDKVASGQLWLDGERIPPEVLPKLFRHPPGLPERFLRNSLIVGGRGAGKTTLFRFHKSQHPGVALRLPLVAELGAVAKTAHVGPSAHDLTPTKRRGIAGKTISLLALAIAERLARRGFLVPESELTYCLPLPMRSPRPAGNSVDAMLAARERVAPAPVDEFVGLADGDVLYRFIEMCGEVVRQQTGELLLLEFDRGELVAPASLEVVVRLLDQSINYLALVAIRPGVGYGADQSDQALVAGDHYSLYHLGSAPRHDAWISFVTEALNAQPSTQFGNIHADDRLLIVELARDSVRIALELAASGMGLKPNEVHRSLIDAAEELRDSYLTTARSVLFPIVRDYRAVVAGFRADVIERNRIVDGPVLIDITDDEAGLLPIRTRTDGLLENALRHGAMVMIENEAWKPGLRPRSLELPPLFTWRRDDPVWLARAGVTSRIPVKSGALMSRPTRRQDDGPSVFVAYRMADQQSRLFRDSLDRLARVEPSLETVSFVDGRLPAGTDWPSEIRRRIKSAAAMIADVTGLRSDVMFEVGVGWRSGLRVIPAVREHDDKTPLPDWLTRTQVGYFAEDVDIGRLLDDLVVHLNNPRYAKLSVPPRPVPGLIAWLRTLSWNSHARDQLEAASIKNGWKRPEVFDLREGSSRYRGLPETDIAQRLASAHVLVASLDGTINDAFVTFIAGAIVAKPLAGGPKQPLKRHVILLQEPTFGGSRLVADSLRKAPELVRLSSPDDVAGVLEEITSEYEDWKRRSK